MHKLYVALALFLLISSCDPGATDKPDPAFDHGTDDPKGKQGHGKNTMPPKYPYSLAPKEEEELKGATQPVIKSFSREEVAIRMSDGTLTETKDGSDWIIRPNGCQKWNYKEFGKKAGEKEMGHYWPKEATHGTGILPYAIRGLLEGGEKGSEVVVIVSIGVTDDLGISQEARDYLAKLKAAGKIGAYYILNSKEVPAKHNGCVKAGKRVYTLLHSTC